MSALTEALFADVAARRRWQHPRILG